MQSWPRSSPDQKTGDQSRLSVAGRLNGEQGSSKSKRDKLEQPRRQRPTRFEIASDPYQYYFESKSKTNTLTSHHPLNLLADDHQALRDTESASHVHKLRNQALRSEIHVLYSTLP